MSYIRVVTISALVLLAAGVSPARAQCPCTHTTTKVKGSLTANPGRFNYNAQLGLPGANSACNTHFPGTHACTYAELQSAPTGDRCQLKDTAGNTVTSFWAINSAQPPLQQCNDDAVGGSGSIGNTGRRTLPPAVRRWRSLTPPAPSGRSSRACSAISPATAGSPAVSRLLSVKNVASPARACRRRRISRPTAALLSCCLAIPGCALPTSARATASCSTPGAGWCVARRIAGSVRSGELGFRFGEPLDVDGDGHADIAAGARFKLWHGTQQNGSATVWSGASGAPIREWDGKWNDGLFGHWVMPVPDLSGDGLADVVIAAPHAQVDGIARGILVARSPKTGEELWQRAETAGENLGWDLALAGD